jgi:hypothetical protein
MVVAGRGADIGDLTHGKAGARLGGVSDQETPMFPFLFAPNIHWPLSGNVVQDIAPSFNQELAGIPEVEYEVLTSVASYGTQLGILTDAVLALAAASGVEGEEIAAVATLKGDVEAAKGRALEAVRARAARAQAQVERLRG